MARKTPKSRPIRKSEPVTLNRKTFAQGVNFLCDRDPEKAMKSFTWDANDYARHSTIQKSWARELIAKLNLQGNEHLLDIGCGDGKVTAELAERLPDGSVLGIDNSASMIELAQKTFAPRNHPNLSFQLADARNLTFEHLFEVVFSNAALHWAHDHRPILKGIWRSLRPGGRILLQMGGDGNAAAIIRILDKMIAEKNWKQYFNYFEFPYGFHPPDVYIIWLEKTGFDAQRVALIPKLMKHDGESALAGWIRTTWLPYTERIPKKHRTKFIQELTHRYIKENSPDADGRIHVQMVRLEVEALKKGGPFIGSGG